MSQLTVTENLGSQMGNVACLYVLSKQFGHKIMFLNSWTEGHGLKLPLAFDKLPLDIINPASLDPQDLIAENFVLDPSVVVDSRVFKLQADLSYNFLGLFNSYRYWYSRGAQLRGEVLTMYTFKPEIVEQSVNLVNQFRQPGRELVSIHVRRGDYLTSTPHHNLSLEYYKKAIATFDEQRYSFLVFSDDIEWSRQAFASYGSMDYSTQGSPYVDMCAMSLCDHQIIANSTFSCWSALLNVHPGRQVVCPTNFLKQDIIIPYFNGAWYPDDWMGIDD